MQALRRCGGLLLFVSFSAVLLIVSRNRDIAGVGSDLPMNHATGWIDEQTCADCHFDQTELFALTGHARSLRLASEEESVNLLRKLREVIPSKNKDLSVSIEQERIQIIDRSGNSIRKLPLDWCFGSGEHARTWVGTLSDSWGELELVEFRWSWFHQSEDFGVTPGQQESTGAGYFHSLGTMFDAPKARDCFSCHATIFPQQESRNVLRNLHAGVTCQRCHGPRKAHVESAGAIREGFWAIASQRESVNRCGECHRVPEDQEPGRIEPENIEIVRFQPVGLTQSPCFQESGSMTCITCHDPHRPLSAQDSKGIWQCVQCHNGTALKQSECRAGHRDDCLRCHMPKVKVFESVDFTDHWIRIRDTPAKPSP